MKIQPNKIFSLIGGVIAMVAMAGLFSQTVSAQTVVVTCKDGTVINAPSSANPATLCASHGGVAPAQPTATSTVKCEDGNQAGDCAKTTSFSFAGCGTDNVGIRCLAIEVLKFLSITVGLAVIGGVAVGGIVYSTAQGSPGKTESGIKIITNSIIALVLYLLMFAILHFLIPGGVIGT